MPFGFLGSAIAARDDVAVFGAPGQDYFEGAVLVYRKVGESWQPAGTVVSDATALEPITGAERRCTDGEAGPFACSDVDLVSFLPVSALGGGRGMIVNDLWGWTDPETGREYAIVGRADATVFNDLGDPANPVYLGELPLHEGANPNLWRDVKVSADHAFIVSDGAGPHGVQVFDLRQRGPGPARVGRRRGQPVRPESVRSQPEHRDRHGGARLARGPLRDVADAPVTFEETAHYDRIHSAHNIMMNEETGFAYVVGASMGGKTCGRRAAHDRRPRPREPEVRRLFRRSADRQRPHRLQP